MKAIMKASLAAALLTFALGATATQLPSAKHFVFWTNDEIKIGYRSLARIYDTDTAKRSSHVRRLSAARPSLQIQYEENGQARGVDDFVKDNSVAGVLVLHRGKIVLERYGLGQRPSDTWNSNSMAKSVVSTLIGAAIADGSIKSLDDDIVDYLAELKGSAWEGVTIRQALLMSSGVRYYESYTDPNADGAKFPVPNPLGEKPDAPDLLTVAAALPREAAAGSKFSYSSGTTRVLGALLTKATGKPLAHYLSEKIWRPAGMARDATWIKDTSGWTLASCCLSATLRDFGRFALFVNEGGKTSRGQLLPADWTLDATRGHTATDWDDYRYGYQWWVKPDGSYRAVGVFGQLIHVAPAEDLIVVVLSAWPEPEWGVGYERADRFIEAVTRSLHAKPLSKT